MPFPRSAHRVQFPSRQSGCRGRVPPRRRLAARSCFHHSLVAPAFFWSYSVRGTATRVASAFAREMGYYRVTSDCTKLWDIQFRLLAGLMTMERRSEDISRGTRSADGGILVRTADRGRPRALKTSAC